MLSVTDRILFNILILLAFVPTVAQTQEADPFAKPEKVARDIHPADVIHWRPGAAQLYADDVIEANLQLFTEQDFTIYVDKLKFSAASNYELIRVIPAESSEQLDPITGENAKVYRSGDFRVFFKATTRPNVKNFELEVTYLGCTTRICLFPYTEKVHLPIYETSSVSVIAPPKASDTASQSSQLTSTAEEDLETRLATKLRNGEFSFYMMLAIVFIGGLLTNLTPCVAPMIPITIRLLAKQKFSPLINASLYAAGIMITYTVLGSIATLSGSAFGTFMQSPVVNAIFACVMAVLGLSMLGFGNLAGLQNFGARFGSGAPSAKNTFFMGAGAGLVAAPCTGPILGALLTYTAGRQAPIEGMILMAMYSFGFSLPYVLLGTAASSVTKVKVPPIVQVGIKLVFASVMFGLTFYYLRIPAYGLLQNIKPHFAAIAAVSLGLGIATMTFCVAFTKLQHNKYVLMVPCVLLGLGVFTAWQSTTTHKGVNALQIYKTKEEAFAAAKEANKPILIDNWAEWCEACKKMDVTTFTDAQVIEEITNHWVMLKLDLTESNLTNDAHLEEYGISGLPTLIMLPPDADLSKKMDVVGYASATVLMNRLNEFKGR